ncbi:MAG: hypothetical protein IT535_09065 [Bauldia sp.]|nr:hypothetical protein [Bauldia sp.]
MIDLRDHVDPIRLWLIEGLVRFQSEHPTIRAEHVALYCCPWAGWISLCLDSNPQLDQNCPDFEFVEFTLYDAPGWAADYEAAEGQPTVINTRGEEQSVVDGDEGLNRLFFEFLGDLMVDRSTMTAIGAVMRPRRVGVQLLDSQFTLSWEPVWS